MQTEPAPAPVPAPVQAPVSAASPRLLVCGDSHLLPPRHAAAQGWFDPVRVSFLTVGGATAVGLRHPRSRTQALQKFRDALLPYQPDLLPVFQLGEVDCGFVIWHRATKYGERVGDQLAAAISAYLGFLAELADAGYRNLIVTSAMLPTIRDGQLEGEIAHLRRSVTASQVQRTRLTLTYNERLQAAVAALGLRYLDFTPDLLNRKTGLIKDEFRHPDPADHHLNPDLGGRMWVNRLLPMVTPPHT